MVYSAPLYGELGRGAGRHRLGREAQDRGDPGGRGLAGVLRAQRRRGAALLLRRALPPQRRGGDHGASDPEGRPGAGGGIRPGRHPREAAQRGARRGRPHRRRGRAREAQAPGAQPPRGGRPHHAPRRALRRDHLRPPRAQRPGHPAHAGEPIAAPEPRRPDLPHLLQLPLGGGAAGGRDGGLQAPDPSGQLAG